MSKQSEKDKRKKILRHLKDKEKAHFLNFLPLGKDIFQELFDYLDENLGDECDHEMTLTIKFLEEKEIENIDQVIDWLNDNGGYCDCEVLANVEEKFE